MASTTHKALDDLAYDLIAILHHKAQGLHALERYMKDAQDDDETQELLERIRHEDERQIEHIKRCVVRCLEGERNNRRSGAV
jgi:hypothetical protein